MARRRSRPRPPAPCRSWPCASARRSALSLRLWSASSRSEAGGVGLVGMDVEGRGGAQVQRRRDRLARRRRDARADDRLRTLIGGHHEHGRVTPAAGRDAGVAQGGDDAEEDRIGRADLEPVGQEARPRLRDAPRDDPPVAVGEDDRARQLEARDDVGVAARDPGRLVGQLELVVGGDLAGGGRRLVAAALADERAGHGGRDDESRCQRQERPAPGGGGARRGGRGGRRGRRAAALVGGRGERRCRGAARARRPAAARPAAARRRWLG